MRLKHQRRMGTSIHEFNVRFPDDDSCLEHIFEANGGLARPCPQCLGSARWYHVRNTRRYVTNCCDRRSFYPMMSTVFARSNIPLRKWFRGLLYLTNADAGLSTGFFSAQLGISSKAAWRMANRLRQHLTLLDRARPLGGAETPVYVAETALGNVIRKGAALNVKTRILVLGDGRQTCFLALPQGPFRQGRQALESLVAPSARIIIRSSETAAKIHNHRTLSGERAVRFAIAPDAWSEPFGGLEAAILRMKRFVLHAHLRIDADYLPGYLGHFSYLWNSRDAAESAFELAIRSFPDPSASARDASLPAQL